MKRVKGYYAKIYGEYNANWESMTDVQRALLLFNSHGNITITRLGKEFILNTLRREVVHNNAEIGIYYFKNDKKNKPTE